MTGGMGGRRNPGAPKDLAVDLAHGPDNTAASRGSSGRPGAVPVAGLIQDRQASAARLQMRRGPLRVGANHDARRPRSRRVPHPTASPTAVPITAPHDVARIVHSGVDAGVTDGTSEHAQRSGGRGQGMRDGVREGEAGCGVP